MLDSTIEGSYLAMCTGFLSHEQPSYCQEPSADLYLLKVFSYFAARECFNACFAFDCGSTAKMIQNLGWHPHLL